MPGEPRTSHSHIYGGIGGSGGQSVQGPGGPGGRGEAPTINHNYYSFDTNSGTYQEVNLNAVSSPNTAGFPLVSGQVFSHSKVYCTEMLRQDRGFPLYQPAPQESLPEESQRHGVLIGDVGTVTPEGIFDFFFNIFLPPEHPINANNTPEGFLPMQPAYNSRDVTKVQYDPGNYISSPTVRRQDCDASFPDGGFLFHCNGPEGAVLALPHGAYQLKLQNLNKLRGYVTKHAASWYKYIYDSLGRELANGDLYLITGHEKAPSWGMASYYANDQKFSLTFKADSNNPTQHRWVGVEGQTNPSQPKCYNRPLGDVDILNQTVFLHGWTISLGTGLWNRLFGTVTVKTSSLADFKWWLNRHGGFHVAGPQGWLFLLWPFNFWRASGPTGGRHLAEQNGEVVLSDFPPTSKVCNPAQLINEYIIRKSPNATVVITHDDDWCKIFGDDSEITTPSDFLQRIDDQFTIAEEDDATFLVPKAANLKSSAMGSTRTLVSEIQRSMHSSRFLEPDSPTMRLKKGVRWKLTVDDYVTRNTPESWTSPLSFFSEASTTALILPPPPNQDLPLPGAEALVIHRSLTPAQALQLDLSFPSEKFRRNPQLTLTLLNEPACQPPQSVVHLNISAGLYAAQFDVVHTPRGWAVTVGDVLTGIHGHLRQYDNGRAPPEAAPYMYRRIETVNGYCPTRDAQQEAATVAAERQGIGRLVDHLLGHTLFTGLSPQLGQPDNHWKVELAIPERYATQ
ncbi:Pleiotropic drug resistance ABC transporter protein [Mycena venus]|uniref:Pleiotropic drug resistance ABC transporter protein n=1 Tax=Mycena venus TaxID=2733690 RepID=A0A8H6XT65_9AGAR|nr:Pleiotropic drug resistance ABC transporter protein [Mycena venus]